MSRLLLYRARPLPRKTQLCCICDKYRIKNTYSFEPGVLEEFYEKNELVICHNCQSTILDILKNMYKHGMLSCAIVHLVEYCCRLDLIDLLLQIITNYPVDLDNKDKNVYMEDIDKPNNLSDYLYNIKQHLKTTILEHGSVNIFKVLNNKVFTDYAKNFLHSMVTYFTIVNNYIYDIPVGYFRILRILGCSDKCLEYYTKTSTSKCTKETYNLLRDNIVRL